MTKQECINQAYNDYPELLLYSDENGWCGYYNEDTDEPLIPLEFIDIEDRNGYEFYRLKTLRGIENNDGWVTIQDISTVPNEIGRLYWVMKKGYDYPTITHFHKDDQNYWLEHYTHYQLIHKPKLPLYT